MTARPTETLIEKHTRLALSTLGNAEREIEAGDLPQAGEKLWGASCHAIKAYCASHDLPHGKYQRHRHAVMELADRSGNPFVRAAFGVAESCHANFYNDWMEQEHLEDYLPDIQDFVRIILDAKAK